MAPQKNNEITITEAAARIGISESTIRRLANEGRLDVRRSGARRFVTRDSVESEVARRSGPYQKERMGRRVALGKILKDVAVACLGGITSKAAFVLYDKITEDQSSVVEIEDLFPRWSEIQVVPGSHHPIDGYHPDIHIALERLAPLVPRSDPLFIARADELPVADLSRDLLTIGGPVANELSLRLHGYRYYRHKISERPIITTDFRWYFHYPERQVGDPSFSRYVAGQPRSTWPKAIVDNKASGRLAEPIFPSVDDRGRILSDFLLLTVVPNNFMTRSTGSTIIDVADLNGQGDKAFAVIVNDNSCRKELVQALRRKRYFQALYEVSVEHDDTKGETIPGLPRLIDVHALS